MKMRPNFVLILNQPCYYNDQDINQKVSKKLTGAGLNQLGLYGIMCAGSWRLFNTRYSVKQEERPQLQAVSSNNIGTIM